jgi:energy-coupling factor transporter ATP-binding protein EcfA2
MASILPADPAGLLECVERWSAELCVRGLGDEVSRHGLQVTLAQARGERLDAPADPLLVVMLCGPTAVGKSSLINALAGADISCPGLGAMTSAAVLYVHEQDDPSRLFEYGEAVGQWARQPHTVIRHTRDALRHKVLVDTPDLDSVVRQHGEVTAALVRAADVVLFVTTPEKYKSMQAAQWVAQQCHQRALVFVLNKWDREGFGLQYERREMVEDDFRRLLMEGGFASPVLFKVSARYEPLPQQSGNALSEREENQLPELQAWLETGLDRSTSGAIQARRRRAAWGRIAAVVAGVVPAPIGAEPWVTAAARAFTEAHPEGRRLAQAMVEAVAANYADRALWPVTPGLFGIYTQWLTWCTSVRSGWRAFGSGRGTPQGGGLVASETSSLVPQDYPAWGAGAGVGDAVVALLGDVTRRLLLDVEAHRLPLQPVRAGWTDAVTQLTTHLAAMPALVEGEIVAEAGKPSVRRGIGWVALAGVEVLLSGVLALVLWRVGTGFLLGEYASASMLLSAMTLVVALLLVGHMVARLCFPALRQRFRTALARRVDAAVDMAWQQAQDVLRDHVAAVDRLAQEGHVWLRAMDHIVHSLARPAQANREVPRLFGDPVVPAAAPPPTPAPGPVPERRQGPHFD